VEAGCLGISPNRSIVPVMTPEVEARRMRLLALVETGELSSPRLLELWRDLNVALADKTAAEQRAIDAGELGDAFIDPNSEWARAGTRHAALYEALIAEAELALGGREIEVERPQILSDEMKAALSPDEQLAAQFVLLMAERHERRTNGRSVQQAGWERTRDGRLILTAVTTLHSGHPVYHRHLIEGRKLRSIHDRSFKKDMEEHGHRFERAMRGYWFNRDDPGVVATDENVAEAWARLDEPM
jgi:hypothetical protein